MTSALTPAEVRSARSYLARAGFEADQCRDAVAGTRGAHEPAGSAVRVSRADVVCLRAQGLPVNEVAERLGCAVNTVARVLREAGVGPVSHRGAPRGSVDRAEVVRLRKEGLRLREIAERQGCSVSHVSNVLRREAPSLASGQGRRGRGSRIDVEAAADLRESGLTMAQVADLLGCTAQGVSGALADARSRPSTHGCTSREVSVSAARKEVAEAGHHGGGAGRSGSASRRTTMPTTDRTATTGSPEDRR